MHAHVQTTEAVVGPVANEAVEAVSSEPQHAPAQEYMETIHHGPLCCEQKRACSRPHEITVALHHEIPWVIEKDVAGMDLLRGDVGLQCCHWHWLQVRRL